MGNEIVKFSNQFNNQALRRFTALDLDLLMSISSRVRDKGTDEVTLTFEELRTLIRLKKNLTNQQLGNEIIQVNERLLGLNFMFKDGSKVIQFALFQTFETDFSGCTLTVAVHPKFKFLLNDLTANFTRFELEEFVDLKSSYSKEFFRRAKQYRSTGVWAVSLDEFRRLLDVPVSYGVADLNKRVLKPIQDELGNRIDLKIERKFQKKKPGCGRPSLVGFVFHFHFDERHPAPEKVNGKPISRGKAAERERNKIAREWCENHADQLGDVSLYEVAKYAREHTEIELEKLPYAFGIRFLP